MPSYFAVTKVRSDPKNLCQPLVPPRLLSLWGLTHGRSEFTPPQMSRKNWGWEHMAPIDLNIVTTPPYLYLHSHQRERIVISERSFLHGDVWARRSPGCMTHSGIRTPFWGSVPLSARGGSKPILSLRNAFASHLALLRAMPQHLRDAEVKELSCGKCSANRRRQGKCLSI